MGTTTAHEILHFSDPHLFADEGARLFGRDPFLGWRNVLAAARSGGPAELAIVTGDISHDGSPAAYRLFTETAEDLGMPVAVVSGNHDDPEAFRRAFVAPPGNRVGWRRQMDVGRWRLVFLNSQVPGEDGGRLAATEWAALTAVLTENPDRPLAAVVHHHPLWSGTAALDRIMLADGDRLLATAKEYPNLRTIFFGHLHVAVDRDVDGVRCLGAPSTCVGFKAGIETAEPSDDPPAYRRTTLFDDGRIMTRVEQVL